ncbi:peroxisomal carnitine O-octanoyltransferase [Ischnura elegans]|uniref:peroxisomal carnitine O-octanoyltransferase n=1 Tax=Ischnura elegans TaxID=197161 RepID=UPI001ED87344|nr:peroxisomal carnitine O-octanoyltransferase [Ischnura elegans]
MALRKDSYISKKMKTFAKDESLPPLPIPPLKYTLDKYVESVLPFLDQAELDNTKKIVNKFHSGLGRELHKELLLKAKRERNWVEKWWEKYAYLSLREPLVPFYSMIGVSNWDDSPVPLSHRKSLSYASLYCYYLVEFWKLLREQKLKPNQNAEKLFFTMKNFRNIFNSTRLPGVEVDSMTTYFKTEDEGTCPSHVVVLAQGRIFVFDALDASGQIITPPEWESCFKRILCLCDEKGPGQGVSALTNESRPQWAKNREWLQALSSRNAFNLELIDKALLVLVLESGGVDCETGVMHGIFCGEPQNRWVDKSLNMVFFDNSVVGAICDHAQYDGMVSIQTFHYVYLAIGEIKGEWDGSRAVRDLPFPKELEFDLDSNLHQQLSRIKGAPQDIKYTPLCARQNFHLYGKDFISSFKLHPDSFVQMALQLAYYRLHGRPAPTYETATTRSFYNGRTETVRSCSFEAITWVKAMLNDKISEKDRKSLLEKAINKHNQLMKQGKANAGCDRHLFGLQCIAMEKGLEVPEIFKDPAWAKSGGGGNFVLSTSLVGYTPMGGCVAPMCLDGYGTFYNICPESIHFSISAWRGSSESSSPKFANSIGKSLVAMKRTLESSYSKL